MKIGDRIKRRREELGLSQDELARRLGYKSRSSINKIERDAGGLPQTKIADIAKALQTTPSYIMGWHEEIKRNPAGMAELHAEMIMDNSFTGLYEDYKTLDDTQKKLVAELVHSLANKKREA